MNNNIENEAINVLVSTIKEATEKIVSTAHYDSTLIGIISAVENGLYVVKINGNEYKIKSSISKLTEGQKVRITIPRNNWNDMYISNTVDEYDNIISINKIDGLDTISFSDIDNLF